MPEVKPKQIKAWIVISPVKPPADWGFKPNPWRSRYIRVTGSLLHARQLKRDLDRLEIPRTKVRIANFLIPT